MELDFRLRDLNNNIVGYEIIDTGLMREIYIGRTDKNNQKIYLNDVLTIISADEEIIAKGGIVVFNARKSRFELFFEKTGISHVFELKEAKNYDYIIEG